MKKLLTVSLAVAAGVGLVATQASALTIKTTKVTLEEAIAGPTFGYEILESFDDEVVTPLGAGSIETKVDGTADTFGTFSVERAAPGLGDATYSTTTPLIGIKSGAEFGRGDLTTDESRTGNFLESGDVTSVNFELAYTDINNIFFYMMDPSDQGGVTVTSIFGDTTGYKTWNPGEMNGGIWLVEIRLFGDEVLTGINWTVDSQRDGWGIDKFGINTDPVPEPATMLLFGAGLAGLAGVRRRTKK